MSRDPEADFEFQREVCDWLRANGVDPNRTPMQPNASMSDGQLTILRKVGHPGEHGRLVDVIDPADPNRVLTEAITVPVVVQPSPDVAEWLAPRSPTCGR